MFTSLLSKIIAAIAAASIAALVLVGWLWRAEVRENARLADALNTAVSVNADNERARLAREAELAAVQAQAIKLTEANRALVAAGVALRENLSDAARSCPIVADDLAAIDRLLNPAAGGGAGSPNPSR